MNQKRSPESAGTDPGHRSANRELNDTPRPVKWKRVLAALLTRSLHRFQAERIGDHCLHSTVSKLEAKGVTILREAERVPGFAGTVAHVVRYRLAPMSRERALELLKEAPAHAT